MPQRNEAARARFQLATTRPPDGAVDGVPLWVVPWALNRSDVVVEPMPHLWPPVGLFVSSSVRGADWADLSRAALARVARADQHPNGNGLG